MCLLFYRLFLFTLKALKNLDKEIKSLNHEIIYVNNTLTLRIKHIFGWNPKYRFGYNPKNKFEYNTNNKISNKEVFLKTL